MATHEHWFEHVKHLQLDSTLLSSAEVARRVPGINSTWAGGIFTPSDGHAEPTKAASAIAKAAQRLGAVIVENYAVRSLVTSAGGVSGVLAERGEIKCEHVLLAAGAWSRRFLMNHHIALPTLPLFCSALQTKPLDGPTDVAVGAPDFSFRRHHTGEFIITQRGALDAPLTLDHMLIGLRYRQQLKQGRGNLRIGFGRYFFQDLRLARHWKENQRSPFEQIRTLDPYVNTLPGLVLATGFSGHGFGTSPAAGQLAADILSGQSPLVDPSPIGSSDLIRAGGGVTSPDFLLTKY